MSESVLAESLRSEPVRPELSESQTLESQMAQAEPAVSAGRPQAVQSKQAGLEPRRKSLNLLNLFPELTTTLLVR